MRIGFVHPDLGIGGAERLVVDAALGLQQKGHHIDIWTSHHDPTHCFQETRDGTLNVKVYGDFIPRHIKGKFHVIMAIIRNIWVALALLFCGPKYDVIFCDQISVTNPLLRLRGAKVLFYCHFPDKLLSIRTTFWKTVYRIPIDLLEEFTTGCAHVVLVNSHFTAGKYAEAFTWLRTKPRVLYPCINMQNYDRPPKGEVSLGDVPDGKKLVLSINRFERKKNIALLVRAFALVKSKVSPTLWDELHLVLAGGYDPRVAENVEHVDELKKIVKELGLQGKVSFIQSFSEDQRYVLLKRSITLVYTPSNEHFGIGPLEGMYASKPVIAVNSGGPLETIQHNVTGFLCSPEPESFASAIEEIAKNSKKAVQMGEAGRAWVQEQFSLKVFRDQLDKIVQDMARN
eukprot:Phypoly_transcript_06809.p1 GENE.Phypoly_transcript_06809~~Phypoly_transcript_06809.p1  ORF type:complete len:428 (+),score=54.99 Phypoly_transcript_06809:87-1286(+)